jgi:glycosyltransferase involved in cell wall biosynthesis
MAAIGTETARALPGVRLLRYALTNADVSATHPFARRFDLECRRAEEVLYAAASLSSSGFVPDIMLAHPGWGETLPLRSVFPKARYIPYCELFYQVQGSDVNFDPEFPQTGIDGDINLRLKNAATLLALVDCDRGISPTQWQRSTFPKEYQSKIDVIHEGVDVTKARPSRNAKFRLPSGRVLTKADEVVTFVARSFEPVRGFHILVRALPRILAARPRAQILLLGGEGMPYGASPPPGQTWKSHFLDEIGDKIDRSRVHFAGHTSHADFIRALQISSAHIYFTYPFVLSWSLLEAMSTGCLVIASETPPVQEVVNADNGILVPFFDHKLLADRVIEALAQPRRFNQLRAQARATVVNNYDMRNICLPKFLDFLGLEMPNAPAEHGDEAQQSDEANESSEIDA